MPTLTDPMNALIDLQRALASKQVTLRACSVHKELGVILDEPMGVPRFTYASVERRIVRAVGLLAQTEPIDGVPCFQLGYAVEESSRRRGLGQSIAAAAIDELRFGLSRHSVKQFYVEAVVAVSNAPSNKIARRLLSESPTAGIDTGSKESILQYVKLLVC